MIENETASRGEGLCRFRHQGFTLIELLVVISIIGTLSTIAMTSLNGARAKARDTTRYSDMNEIKIALELYAADHGGDYPSTGGSLVCLGVSSAESCWGGTTFGNDSVNAALAPYLALIPKDPLYGQTSRVYRTYAYRSPGSYWLPSPVNTVTGAYAIAFEADKYTGGDPYCGGWTFGAWDQPPGATHCPAGGNCRQCGYLAPA